ncbi:hypothetical protein ACIBMZ_15075 [Micromonospora sp. NPDC049900]|uniref:hypothetical protein n=1 Tax=Micromonospora sp. NPDC049900 TaxID=3364275 RepID=UPI0037AAB0E7
MTEPVTPAAVTALREARRVVIFTGGATVIQVDPAATPLDAVADGNLRGSAARVLPALVRAAWGTGAPG